MEVTEKQIISETQFYTVEKVVGDKVQLKNDLGQNIVVTKQYLNDCTTSADTFKDTEKVSKTQLAELFLSNPRTAMTVCFNKQIKEADVKKQMADLYPNKGGKLLSEKEYTSAVTKVIKQAINGEERVMKGRHYSATDEFGRIQFVDMEIERSAGSYDNRLRLVDPRTIKYMIVNGKKYQVK